MERGTEGSFRGAGNILYFDWGGDYTSEFTLLKEKSLHSTLIIVHFFWIYMNISNKKAYRKQKSGMRTDEKEPLWPRPGEEHDRDRW